MAWHCSGSSATRIHLVKVLGARGKLYVKFPLTFFGTRKYLGKMFLFGLGYRNGS